MTDNQQQQATLRINHADYIELQFQESSRRAVDELVVHLIEIVAENTAQEPLRIFVNNGEVRRAQSIAYLLGQMRQHQKQFSVKFPVRIAANFNMMLIASLLELFVHSLATNQIQFKAFSINNTEGAIDWLVEE